MSKRNRNADNNDSLQLDDLSRAYHFFWDKGRRVPADLAARLIERGIDVEFIEAKKVD